MPDALPALDRLSAAELEQLLRTAPLSDADADAVERELVTRLTSDWLTELGSAPLVAQHGKSDAAAEPPSVTSTPAPSAAGESAGDSPTPPLPPGWYTDPWARKGRRFWDGTQWTSRQLR